MRHANLSGYCRALRLLRPQMRGQSRLMREGLCTRRPRAEILQSLGLKDRTNLAKEYVQPALAAGLIEMTIPDKPRSSKQKYRLTDKGRELQERMRQSR